MPQGCSGTGVGAGTCRENVPWVVRVSKLLLSEQHNSALLSWAVF